MVCIQRYVRKAITTFIKPVRYSVEDKLFVAGRCHLDGVTRRCFLVVEVVLVHKDLWGKHVDGAWCVKGIYLHMPLKENRTHVCESMHPSESLKCNHLQLQNSLAS